jgi:drug/metabolite transporter (DMT)-like permease
MKYYIFACISLSFNLVAQYFFKLSADNIDSAAKKSMFMFFRDIYNDPVFVIFALLLFVFSSFFWLLSLKGLSISKAFSITSFNYIFIPVLSNQFFNEEFSYRHIFGIIFIFFGVFLTNFKKSINGHQE